MPEIWLDASQPSIERDFKKYTKLKTLLHIILGFISTASGTSYPASSVRWLRALPLLNDPLNAGRFLQTRTTVLRFDPILLKYLLDEDILQGLSRSQGPKCVQDHISMVSYQRYSYLLINYNILDADIETIVDTFQS